MLRLPEFDALVGQDSYVRCRDKERIDPAIISLKAAESHLFSGGTIGWWVRPGYIVVDVDEGKEKFLKILKMLGLQTLMTKTPKGVHLYFKTNKDFPQKIGMVLPSGLKCDFRCANKGYVMLPYGMEQRGFSKYRKIVNMPLEFTPMANRKDSLLNLKEGDGRNTTLFAHLMAYKNLGANDAQIRTMANVINSIVFDESMTEPELKRIITNTKKYESKKFDYNPYLMYSKNGIPVAINYRAINDYFVNSGDIFVIGGECYRYYNGVYTKSGSYVRNAIKEMIAVDTLISQARIIEAFKLILDDARLQKLSSDLNSDINLINFKNGVWDISHRKLTEHSTHYLQTIQIPSNVKSFVPFEKTLLYEFFMLCKLSEEDIKMVTEYMAYCLTLNFGLKTFMILVGQSNTGKSVLIRFFERLVGVRNTSAISMHDLNMRFYPAQLYNKLLNCCADNSSLPLKSIEQLKKITGGDQIMHEIKSNPNIFFFVAFTKLIFSFNQLPLQLEEKSNAFYKRMRILPMTNELDLTDTYVNKLCSKESVEQVIPYLLSLLPIKKISITLRSDKLVEDLRRDSDTIHAFLSNKCVKRSGSWVYKKDLYEAYITYCIEAGREAHKKHAFLRYMRSLSLYKEVRHKSTREACWKGLKLK